MARGLALRFAMKNFRSVSFLGLGFAGFFPAVSAQSQQDVQAAAAVASGAAKAEGSAAVGDFLEHLVDKLLHLFGVETSGNSLVHYAIAAGLLLFAFLLRRVFIRGIFGVLKRLAAKTETTLDDKLFVSLERPMAMMVVLLGAMGAVKVLKLSPTVDEVFSKGMTMAFSFTLLWLFLKAFGTVMDHLHEVAQGKSLGIAAFMPWIKKSLLTVIVIFGVLMVAQSMGADVKAFLAGLGIGGLAFALAAQDTIANVFGSVVVAVDQPYKVGEVVKISGYIGGVEEIGLRSTRIRLLDGSYLTMPNKTVASESIVNLSRFTKRRVEQVIGLTYDTPANKMAVLVEEIRALLKAEPEVETDSVITYFRDFNASSMDIWIVFNVKDPDFHKHMALRQRINLAIMARVEAHGLSFAFPTQTVHLDGSVAKELAAAGKKPA